jgi:hypothetical protein
MIKVCVDLFDKDIMATVTKNSQILNGNAALSDGFRVAHSYLAKSDLDKLISAENQVLQLRFCG